MVIKYYWCLCKELSAQNIFEIAQQLASNMSLSSSRFLFVSLSLSHISFHVLPLRLLTSLYFKYFHFFSRYGNYPQLCQVFHKYMNPRDNILMAGCGNSTLSADLYNAGFKYSTTLTVSWNILCYLIFLFIWQDYNECWHKWQGHTPDESALLEDSSGHEIYDYGPP